MTSETSTQQDPIDRIRLWDHLPLGWEWDGGTRDAFAIQRRSNGNHEHITLRFHTDGRLASAVFQAFNSSDETVGYKALSTLDEALAIAETHVGEAWVR